jgi:4'-phosphopantetheinyl transferase
VDIEDRTSDPDTGELAAQYFAEAEARAVSEADGSERLRTFYKLWCLKEAALKSIGEGSPAALAAFEFEMSPHLRVVDTPRDHCEPDDIDARLIEETDICAALVARILAR